jgi:hypothetical protein
MKVKLPSSWILMWLKAMDFKFLSRTRLLKGQGRKAVWI